MTTLDEQHSAVQGQSETERLTSLNPATGEQVASFEIADEAEVRAAVARAREAAVWWQAQGYEGRRRALLRWARAIAADIDDFAALLHRENGKPVSDAQIETMLALEHIEWAALHAPKVLASQKRRPGALFANFSARVDHVPFGVVGVIGPWNYPVFTPNGSIASALAAGNTVVYKPSEYTPAIAQRYVDAFVAANPAAPAGVLATVQGLGPTGAALSRAGVHKLAFTGSAATGRRVMAACAETLTPVVMELGGKDAAIVAADADLASAASAIAFGAFSNGGQTCVGIERVYVERSVRDEFCRRLVDAAAALTPGSGAKASYGPMTMASQLDVVREHVTDAIASGAVAIHGGPHSIGERFVSPIVLLDPPQDSLAVQEETFGPTLTIQTVDSLDEAISLANDSRYGLAGSVFSREHAEAIVARLDTSQVSVNSVLGFAGISSLPLGGRGDSGFGRIHGPEGLLEFTRTRAVATQKFATPGVNPVSFTRPRWFLAALPSVIRWRYSRRKEGR